MGIRVQHRSHEMVLVLQLTVHCTTQLLFIICNVINVNFLVLFFVCFLFCFFVCFCFFFLFFFFCFILVIIDHPLFISRFIGNSLWLIALVYYIYISFLGYSGEFDAVVTFLTRSR